MEYSQKSFWFKGITLVSKLMFMIYSKFHFNTILIFASQEMSKNVIFKKNKGIFKDHLIATKYGRQ